MQPSRFAIVQDAGPAKLNEQHRPDRRSFPPEEYYMRFLPRLLMLVSLAAPLAHAELLDDVHQRGALRIALEGTYPPFNFKQG
ncbi:cystine ABC transporter substrate-binding protein, partial [Pseudomonas aeruginosa]